MDITSCRSLHLLLELDELKSDTTTTKEIVEVLKKLVSLEGDKKVELHELIERIRQSLRKMLDSVKRRRCITSKLDKLYCLFHEFSVGEGFALCSSTEEKLQMKVPEILWQMLLEKEFTCFLTTYVSTDNTQPDSGSDQSSDTTFRVLSEIEKNAVRYTAGYVIRKLEEKYSKQKSQQSKECTAALQVMAGKLHTRITQDSEQSSNNWISMVNRGGLYFVEDVVYDLFVNIELLVDSKLSEIMKECGKGIKQVKKENLAWVCEDEEVQNIWNHVSPDSIEEEEVRQDLLREITYMWVTIRGHSKTHKIKEDYKLHQRKTVKRTRSLRKELESQ